MPAMDKIPKFRRKPKNPTIETAVERTSSDTADSAISSDTQAVLNIQQKQQKNHKDLKDQKDPTSKSSNKKSPFRNFRLRNPAKRARASPPTELPFDPPPAIVTSEGARPQTSPPATLYSYYNKMRDGGEHPRIPAFLALSANDIENKFQDLTWAERLRVQAGSQYEGEDEAPWTFFRHGDGQEKDYMDRYINIKPWAHNRIKLQVPEDELDYVNASAITLESPTNPELPPLRYIAMQGPTEPSLSYVWRMVAEQASSPAVIVQLTTMSENGAVKCHQYFPDDEEQCTWIFNEDNVWSDGWQAQLTYDACEELLDGTIEKRRLLLHVDGEEEPRIVWHFLYRNWPDFGVPELKDLQSFFHLMQLSREHSAPDSPRIIHCSAGVGRTGTFIALEHLMRELGTGGLEVNGESNEQQPDLVFDTINHLREQRFGMVQGLAQLKFIYQVMRKLWQDRYGLDQEGGEPAPKRIEVGEPLLEEGPGPDANDEGAIA